MLESLQKSPGDISKIRSTPEEVITERLYLLRGFVNTGRRLSILGVDEIAQHLNETRTRFPRFWPDQNYQPSVGTLKILASSFKLTEREGEILESVVLGQTSKRIGTGFHLSPKTVENYRNHILKKLDVRSHSELTVRMINDGWFNAGTLAQKLECSTEEVQEPTGEKNETSVEISQILTITGKLLKTFETIGLKKKLEYNAGGVQKLTPGEERVLKAMAEKGGRIQDVANTLNLSSKTVENYLYRSRRRFGAKNSIELLIKFMAEQERNNEAQDYV